jgi:pimeloyl-ACP methyl ester carboxylesterase/DNA-binding SARP family transcriptional activator
LPDQPPITIRLLGRLEVARDGDIIDLPQSKKTRALLAYLVASGRTHRRDRLCSMFWNVPDDPRGALRWSLSKLRNLVRDGVPLLIADRDTAAFNPAGAEVDLLALRRLVGAGTGVENAETDALQQAAALFRGQFLEGLQLPDCADFQSWCIAERESLKALQARILTALIGRLAEDCETAIPLARELLQLDALAEPSWTLLIRLLIDAQRFGEADEQFKTAVQTLSQIGGASDALLRLGQDVRTMRSTPAAGREDKAGPSRSEPPQITAQKVRFCEAEDGVRIAYAAIGDGPPLVKPANWMTHLEYDWESPVWRHWTRELARDHRLIRYDERGNGLSDWNVGELGLDTFVRDLEAVVEAAGLERFPMLGISQGCAVAIAYAVKHPERVSRLVLFGGYARGWALRGSPEEVARRQALGELMKQGWGQDNPAFRQVFTTLFVPEGTPTQMQWFNDLQRMTTSPANAARLNAAFGQLDVRPLLQQVRAPTLVLHCRDDAVVPFAEGRAMANSIPGARFVAIESRNHIILEQETGWQRFLQEMRTFLAENDTAGQGHSMTPG